MDIRYSLRWESVSDQLILDSVQSIYARITSISKSITDLGGSLNALKGVIQDKIGILVNQIAQMNDQVKKEGEMHAEILMNVAKNVSSEIKKLQEEMGIKSIEGLKDNLTTIHGIVKETLKPENVDLLLAEALAAIKVLQGETKPEEKPEISTTPAPEELASEPAPEKPAPGKKGKKPHAWRWIFKCKHNQLLKIQRNKL